MAYNREYHKKYYLKNQEKKKLASKRWKEQNREKARSYRKNERDLRYKRLFGISLQEYEEMCLKQSNVCAICLRPEKNKKLAVDHCHKTGKVRGLLCSRCNQGLGHFCDSVLIMESAIKYVYRNNSN